MRHYQTFSISEYDLRPSNQRHETIRDIPEIDQKTTLNIIVTKFSNNFSHYYDQMNLMITNEDLTILEFSDPDNSDIKFWQFFSFEKSKTLLEYKKKYKTQTLRIVEVPEGTVVTTVMVKKKKIPLGHLIVEEIDWKIYFIHLGDGVILNTYSLGNFERVCEEPLKVERYSSSLPIIAGYQMVPNKSDNCKDYPAKLDMGKYFALRGDENFGGFMSSLRNMRNQEILHEVTLRAVKWDHGLA